MGRATMLHRSFHRRLLALASSVLMLAMLLALAPAQALQSESTSLAGLHVVGNQLVNDANQPVRLLGVNRSGPEYACVGTTGTNGWGFFDGPSDAASVQAIAS